MQNITIVGAGSSYTPGIILALLKNHETFPIQQITLYDNDNERNEDMRLIVDKLLAYHGYTKVVVQSTTEAELAFKDVNFIFIQIRVGLIKMREHDEKICLKHGLVGQETCGLGGFAYGMRTIGGITQILEDISIYAPTAWILNYTNPEAIVGEVVSRYYSHLNMINVCDMTISLEETIAQNFGYNAKEWIVTYYGLNHFGWYKSIYDKQLKRDVMPELLQKMKDTTLEVASFNEGDEGWIETFKMMKLLISNFDDAIPNNYLEYYLYPNKILGKTDINYTRANMVMDTRMKRTKEIVSKIKNGSISDEDLAFNFGEHGQYIVDIATAILNDSKKRFVLITKNDGAIPNFRSDAVVEVPCYIGATGVEKIALKPINDFHKGLMEAQVAAEKLLVDAFYEKSYRKALQAFTLNQTCHDANIAKDVLDEMMEVNKDYWPKLV